MPEEYEFIPLGPALPTIPEQTEYDFEPISESSFMNEFGKGLARGSLNVIEGMGGTAGAAAQYAPQIRTFLKAMTPAAQFVPAGVIKGAYEAPFVGGKTPEQLLKKGKEEFKKIRQEKYPRNAQDARTWAGAVIGEAIPYMGAALAAGYLGGPAGAATVGFSVEGDMAYEEAKRSGASENKAQLERMVIGSINAAIESLQVGQIMKFAKGGRFSLKGFIGLVRQRAFKELAKKGVTFSSNLLKHSINEAIEEFAQEGVSVGVPAILRGEYPKTPEGKTDWVAIGNRLGEAALGGGVAGGILGGGAMVVQTAVQPEVKTTVTQAETV
jgi:hypothetical protein